MLSYVLAHGLAASVFSVPAVWLWVKADELADFVRRCLLGKRVIIVCDADWFTKWEVREAADRCQQLLESLGVRCCVAAPPYDPDDLDPETGKPVQNGVDDFLAHESKPSLLDLRVRQKGQTPHLVTYLALEDVPGIVGAAGLADDQRANRRALDRAVNVHEAVGPLAHGGSLRRRERPMERRTGYDREYLRRGLSDLERWGVYKKLEGSMEYVYNAWSGEREWELVPTLEIPQLLLPKDLSPTVEEWLET